MKLPGFTAERSIAGAGDAYGGGAAAATADASTVTPAEGKFIQIEDTLFYCYPCMSGGPAGALVTYCCDAVASTPGGMSWG